MSAKGTHFTCWIGLITLGLDSNHLLQLLEGPRDLTEVPPQFNDVLTKKPEGFLSGTAPAKEGPKQLNELKEVLVAVMEDIKRGVQALVDELNKMNEDVLSAIKLAKKIRAIARVSTSFCDAKVIENSFGIFDRFCFTTTTVDAS